MHCQILRSGDGNGQMVIDFAKLLTICELLILISVIGYVLIIKRDPLDPRLYVLYGLLHWLCIGQLYYVFDIGYCFDFVVYEPVTFTDTEILVGSGLVLTCTVAFIIGYTLMGLSVPRYWASGTSSAVLFKRLELGFNKKQLLVSFLLFVLAAVVSSIYENDTFVIPVTILLPIGYLMPVSSIFLVLGLGLHYTGQKRLAFGWRLVSALMLVYIFLTSNIAVIYPLIALCVFIALRIFSRINRFLIAASIMAAPLIVFLAMVLQLSGKTYRRLQNIGLEISLTSFYSVDAFKKSLMNSIVTMDSFNSESFAVILQAIRDFVDQGIYLYGGSIFSVVPLFKLFGGDAFQSFGRVLAIKSLAVDLESHTAFAVSPIGEVAANFSYVGAVGFYFFLGIAAFSGYKKFKNAQSYTSVPVYLVFLIWLFLQQRGDFLNGNMYPAYVLLCTYCVARIFGTTHSRFQSGVHCSQITHRDPPIRR